MNAALAGIWELVRAQQDGLDSDSLLALRITLEIGADTYVVRFAGEIADRGQLAHAAAPPAAALGPHAAALTLRGAAGPNAGRTIPCLYQLAGDRLRIAYGLDGAAPRDFQPGGPHRYVATYRRRLAP
ncbi:MAG: hypothetical protein RLZZ15_3262 [Verrucomicrobiota bacterium]|jgi:uncharacterized protein (TIGR03067 family)